VLARFSSLFRRFGWIVLPFSYRHQRTISRPVALSGFGFWTGEDIDVELRPARTGSGITFVRCDLSPIRRIPVRVENQIDTPRRTTLTAAGATVEMVEHVLAALGGLRIDNCEIWSNAGEMPGGDGSSLAFVEAINTCGIATQDELQPRLIIDDDFRVGDEGHFIEASPRDDGRLIVEYDLDYPHAFVGRQHYEIDVTPETFQTHLAAARTFIMEKEARELQARGFAQRVTERDLLVFGDDGLVDNELRFTDECVRHKVLDVVGDLVLLGCDVQGHIRAFRSGHTLNAGLVKTLLRRYKGKETWRFSA